MIYEESAMLSDENEFKLQVIHRTMKKALPKHALVSKDAKSFIEEKAVAFIRNLTRKAKEFAFEEHRTKIKGQDLVKVFESNGLLLYKNVLETYLEVGKSRDAPSESTETDAYDEDETLEDMTETKDHDICDPAPHDAIHEDMSPDHMVLDAIFDPSNHLEEVPEEAEQTFTWTDRIDDVDIFGSVVEDDLMGEKNILPDCDIMPDSWIASIVQNLENEATFSPQMSGANCGADPTSVSPIPVSVPPWTLEIKPISEIVVPSIDIPSLTVHVSNGADLNGADTDDLVANSSLANAFSLETHRISIPAWKIPSATASGVRIPAIGMPSITVCGGGDIDTLGEGIDGLDNNGAMHPQEEQGRGERREHDLVFGAQDAGSTIGMGENGYSNNNFIEAEQALTQQEPYDPFALGLDHHNFDRESLLEFMQGVLDESETLPAAVL